ncbi:D site-binding protein-like [Cydia pomonella]|uniref:D site-binding protein-like n=1 Tax=Cydia pomonella TaxID=82600 RepID=UPI002ADE2DF4|nr:D site-binding protein-like [Cydia pomonella]
MSMSLWTPYADEAALDLTKAVPVKAERASPVPEYRYPSPVPQYPYYAAPQLSPASGSTCSYDEAYLNRGTLSPPDSPTSERLKDSLSDDPEFQAFERDALRAMAEKNGGSLLGNNPRMRRAVRSTNQNAADDSYRSQRQRNNFAAKQSRDRRKLREIHLALKATYLGNEVARLKAQLAGRCCGRCQHPCEC